MVPSSNGPVRRRLTLWPLAAFLFLILLGMIAWRAGLLPHWLPDRQQPVHDPSASPRAIAPQQGLLPIEIANHEVYEKARKSVVYITTLGVRTDSWNNSAEVPVGTGSGFIWSKKDGKAYIVTNFHVIQDASGAQVTLHDGKQLAAELVGAAPDKDLAVLKIDTREDLTPIAVGSSKDVKIGYKAYALGNPFGVGITFNDGIISAQDRSIRSVTGRLISGVIQTNAAINPGNSGGPLLDSSGRLIGVTTAIYGPTGVNNGIGFAIPVDTVNQVVPELIKKGSVERPGLGVQIATARNLGLTKGVLIIRVLPGGAAEAAGLQPTQFDRAGRITRLGDVIIDLDGSPISSADDLFEQLGKRNVGDKVRVTVVRDSKPLAFDLTLKGIGTARP